MAWTKKHQKVLDLLIKEEKAREYFFQTASSPLFIEPLFKKGFFSFKSIPEYPVPWFQHGYLIETAKEIQKYVSIDKRYVKYISHLLLILEHFCKERDGCSPAKALLVFECFCDVFKLLPSDTIPTSSIGHLVSLCQYLTGLNLASYRIKELAQKFLNDKSYAKAQKIFQIFLPILLKSKVKENDKRYFLQEIGKIQFFVDGNKGIFHFLLNILSAERIPKNIIDYQFDDSTISLIHKDSDISGQINFKHNVYRFRLPIVKYSHRNKIVSLVCAKTLEIPYRTRINIANEVKSLYYTHLWKRHYSIQSLFSLEKEERYVCSTIEQLMLFVGLMLKHQANIQPPSKFKKDFLNVLYGMESEMSWRILLFFFGTASPRYNQTAITFLDNHKALLFTDGMFEGEVFDLLSLLASSCKNQNHKKKLIDLIVQGPYWEFINNAPKTKEYERYWKKRWFAALRTLPKGEKEYQKLSDIPKEWINSRDAKSRQVIYQSPFEQADILEKVDNELENFAKNIQQFDGNYVPDEKDFFHEKPSQEGLIEALQKATQESPEIMVKMLSQYKCLNIVYIGAILRGLRHGGKKMDSSCWDIMFTHTTRLLKAIFSGSIYSEQQKDILVIEILGIISDKYQELVEENICFKAMDIIDLIYSHYKIQNVPLEKNNYDSYLTAALNSIGGLMAQAIIGLSLNVGPNKNPLYENVWEERMQNLYEKLLLANVPEAYVFLGYFYDCFLFLNKEWLTKKITSITPKTSERKYFFSGYLYSRAFFPNELQDFKNDYRFLAQNEIFPSSTQEIGAERLVVLLLHQSEFDKIEREIEWLVKHSYPLFLSYVAHSLHNILTFGQYRIKSIEEPSKEVKIVCYFWQQVYRRFKNKELSPVEKKVMEDLLLLLSLIPCMNQQYRNMILASLDVCGEQFPISFLDNLLKITQRTSKENKELCGEILNACIKQFPTHITWYENVLLQLVNDIYKKGTPSKCFQKMLQLLQDAHAHKLANDIALQFNFKL